MDALIYASFLVVNLIAHLLMKKQQAKSNMEYMRATEVQTEVESHIQRQVCVNIAGFVCIFSNSKIITSKFHCLKEKYFIKGLCTNYVHNLP